MTFTQLLPSVQELPHSDKLQLMQWLANELVREDGVSVLSPDVEYPVWSPHDSFEAAAVLNAFAENQKAKAQ